MDTILIHASQSGRRTRALEYGAHLAARLGASVTGAYVHPSMLQSIPPLAPPDLVSLVLVNAKTLGADADRLGVEFVEWTRSLGIKHAAWHVAEDYLPDALAQIGQWHSLLVVGHDADFAWGSPPDIASLIFAATLPAIVVPAGTVEPRAAGSIVVAWNGSAEAIRATRAALPLLKQAHKVVVLMGEHRHTLREISWTPGLEIEEFLRRHDVRFECREFDADDDKAGTALLEASASLKADLLVMGMYGRGRFREWILGGATRQVLEQATLPVLMCH